MFNWCINTIIAFYIVYFGAVTARNVTARIYHECVFLQTRIYCYGGASGFNDTIGNLESSLLNDIFIRLDVSGAYNVTELQNKWETPDGPTVGPNYYFSMVALPNFHSFFIDGGRGTRVGDIDKEVGDLPLQTASLYNASGSGSWRSINTTGRNRVDSHVALVGKNSTVYIYGGKNTIYTPDYFYDSVGLTYPDQLITFNLMRNPQWKYESDSVKQNSPQARVYHKGAFGWDQKTIYYIGGIYDEHGPGLFDIYDFITIDMGDILIYDTQNGSWGSVQANGVSPPIRIGHTVTANPNTGELIVYGGTHPHTIYKPADDFIYTFNTQSLEYKSILPVNSSDAPGAGPRFGHSAIFVNDDLFILFGSDGKGLRNDFHVLDTTSNYTWKPYVPVDYQPDERSQEVLPWHIIVGVSIGLGAPFAALALYGIIKICRIDITSGSSSSVNTRNTQRGVAQQSLNNPTAADPSPSSPQLPTYSVVNVESDTTPESKDVVKPLLVVRLIRPDN